MKNTSKQDLNFNRRFAIISLIVMIVSSLAIMHTFRRLYSASKQNIISKWESRTAESANQVNLYVKTPMDAIAFSATRLNALLKNNGSHEEALNYLVNETNTYATTISGNTTGIYSYYKGKFLDGANWKEPIDYQPKDRPWYIAAFNGGGRPMLVNPYLDARTNSMMMAVSQLLDDLESAVSMDIYMDSLQKMIEKKAASDSNIDSVFVIDRLGNVIADSNPQKVGTNLKKDESDARRIFMKEFGHSAREMIEIKSESGDYTVFAESVNEQWVLLYTLKTKNLYGPLISIYLASFAIILIIIVVILLVFFYMNHKYMEAERLNDEIRAVGSIYVTAAKIDLKTDRIRVIRSNPDFDNLLAGDFTNYSKRCFHFAEQISSKSVTEMVKEFLDTWTLDERMGDEKSISIEFKDNKERWIRLRYIVVKRDEKNRIASALLLFESIEKDKKQQEALKKLSETDMMTGINNRGSGESQIREAINAGKKGMFFLMDVDKFKSINDDFGHQAGDAVIIAIAECLKKAFRDTDIVFRLGGDEFAAFAGGVTTEQMALRILRRFFDAVDSISIPELNGRQITVSAGAAFYPISAEDTFEAMYQRADRGTYKSKERTGNMLTFICD